MAAGNMEVIVIDGEVRDVELLGDQSAYCTLELADNKYKTKTSTNCNEEPVWNDRFTFINVQPSQATQLTVRVWSKRAFHDKEIGAAAVNMARLYTSACEELRVPLSTHKGKSAGHVRLMFIWRPSAGAAPVPGQPQPNLAQSPSFTSGCSSGQASPLVQGPASGSFSMGPLAAPPAMATAPAMGSFSSLPSYTSQPSFSSQPASSPQPSFARADQQPGGLAGARHDPGTPLQPGPRAASPHNLAPYGFGGTYPAPSAPLQPASPQRMHAAATAPSMPPQNIPGAAAAPSMAPMAPAAFPAAHQPAVASASAPMQAHQPSSNFGGWFPSVPQPQPQLQPQPMPALAAGMQAYPPAGSFPPVPMAFPPQGSGQQQQQLQQQPQLPGFVAQSGGYPLVGFCPPPGDQGPSLAAPAPPAPGAYLQQAGAPLYPGYSQQMGPPPSI